MAGRFSWRNASFDPRGWLHSDSHDPRSWIDPAELTVAEEHRVARSHARTLLGLAAAALLLAGAVASWATRG